MIDAREAVSYNASRRRPRWQQTEELPRLSARPSNHRKMGGSSQPARTRRSRRSGSPGITTRLASSPGGERVPKPRRPHGEQVCPNRSWRMSSRRVNSWPIATRAVKNSVKSFSPRKGNSLAPAPSGGWSAFQPTKWRSGAPPAGSSRFCGKGHSRFRPGSSPATARSRGWKTCSPICAGTITIRSPNFGFSSARISALTMRLPWPGCAAG